MAVPVVRPLASRNVVVSLLSRVAVPVARPEPSRNVLVPLLSVLTVPVILPLASRKVVCQRRYRISKEVCTSETTIDGFHPFFGPHVNLLDGSSSRLYRCHNLS